MSDWPPYRNSACADCALHATCNTVCLTGEVPFGSGKVMMVGEAPGRNEDEQGKPFIGAAGAKLHEYVDRHSSLGGAYITNAVKCRPPDNRTPKKREIAACQQYLTAEIEYWKPKFVLILGSTALESVLGIKGITKIRGKPIERDGIIYFPTFHPSALLYDDSNEELFQLDIEKFAEIVARGGLLKEKGTNTKFVNDWKTLDEFLDDLSGKVAFDIETTSLYPWHGQIVSMGFGTRNAQWVLPWDHEDSFWRYSLDEIVKKINDAVKDNDVQFIMQNGKFDSLWMAVHHDVHWPVWFDTMLAHYLIDENSTHGLDFLAARYFGAPGYDIPMKIKQGVFGIDPTDSDEARQHVEYLGLDVYYTRKLWPVLSKLLDEQDGLRRVYDFIVMPCSRMFTKIEQDGVFIDQSKFGEAEKYLRDIVAEAENSLEKTLRQALTPEQRIWWDEHEYKIKVNGKNVKKQGINWGSTQQLAKLLFEDLSIEPLDETAGGNFSTSESVLKRIDHPLVGDLLKLRGAKQQLSFFIEGWKPFLVYGYLHPSFKIHGAVTGRLCLRAGTAITTPGGVKPIENIKAGDWVYGFDADRKLVLQRVKWAGYSGKKRCKRVHWQGTGGKHVGHLDASDSHPIRLIDGSYVRVDQLKGSIRTKHNKWRKGERVLALHRQSRDRNYLYATGYAGGLRENRVVFEAVNGWSPEHVHHDDENPLNDDSLNLIGMTQADHAKIHHSRLSQTEKQRRTAVLRRDDVVAAQHASMRITKRRKAEMRFTRKQIENALIEHGSVLNAKKALNCSYEALRRRMNEWGIKYDGRSNSHVITHVEQLDGKHDVYDLEIDGFPNFIANELCVHNSAEHPNLQQVPRDERIRQLITAPRGWTLLEADLSQIELRIAAELSGDKQLLYAFTHNIDVHWLTALTEISRGGGMADEIIGTACRLKNVNDIDYSEAVEAIIDAGPDACIAIDKNWKEIRKKAKAINFGYLFGMWWKKFKIYARDNYDVIIDDIEAQNSRQAFFELYADLEPWHRKQKRFARQHGYVVSLSGRRRHLPDAASAVKSFARDEAERQGINAPVQSFANEINLMAALQLNEEFGHDVIRMCGTVHDSILVRVKNEYVELVGKRLLEIMRRPKLFDAFDIKLDVPIEADLKIGAWGTGITLDKWLAVNGHITQRTSYGAAKKEAA